MKHRAIPRAALVICLALPALLGSRQARAQGGGTVRFQEQFPREDLRLEQVPIHEQKLSLSRVSWKGAVHPAEEGMPILPCIIRHVAIPAGAVLAPLVITQGQETRLAGHSLVEWSRGEQPGQARQREPVPPVFEKTPDGILFHSPDGRPVPLDPSLKQFPVWPPQPAEVEGTAELGGYQVVTIKLFPVRWAAREGALLLSESITVGISFRGGTVPDPKRLGYRQRSEIEDLRRLVVNASNIPDILVSLVPEDLDAWYLIITDNKQWNADKTSPGPVAGDMVAEFERLAEWKTQKGVVAAVVTIDDILDGRYGNFNTRGTRDLQEVLRNFLKHARKEFNTYWVLLGGDVSVVPARNVLAHTGYGDHYLKREDASKPEENRCYWDAGAQRVRIHHNGYITAATVIVSRQTGKAFSRVVAPSAANPGWTYVTSDSYATTTASATDFIRLVGPLADTELKDFYTSRDLNTIPTDLYYSSVDSSLYDKPGKHDWDLNDNGYYGQYFDGDSLDGVDYWADLALGRAPVESGAEAKAFVDKVIAYEKYDGLPVSFGRRLLLGSANWSGGPAVSSGGADPPAEGKYYGPPGSTSSDCHFSGPPSQDSPFDLVAYDGPGDHWYVPYNRSANASTLGYYWCTSDSYSVRSEVVIDFWFIHIELPIPTKFVKVRGPAALVHPSKYFFDSAEPDSSVVQKELVKEIFADHFPEMSTRKRLYQDFEDTPGYPDPDLFEHSSDAMEAALNTGYNMVSLSGHGSPGGCCGVSRNYVDELTNGFKGGIVYAESCSTNRFPDDDAAGEVFLTAPDGGAAAYVGNSRYSWVGKGDDLERIFWDRLRSDRHVGRLHNSKASLLDGNAYRWANFALNLMGDPEMPLWVGAPEAMNVAHPTCVKKGDPFEVTVTTSGGAPISFARVCLTGPDGIFELHYTGVTGQTTFFTADKESGDDLVLTVTREDRITYQGGVAIGVCGRLFVRGDSNFDFKLDVSDVIATLNYLFTGGRKPACDDAADTNDDGKINLTDSLKLLGYLFGGDRLPPGTTPGQPQKDPTEDGLGCAGD